MLRPRLLVTGASGFVGRHLLDAFKDSYRIFGLARQTQSRSGAPEHPNISWFQVDNGDRDRLESVFRAIRDSGGADVAIHLAAHHDFTGEKHPEYWRASVVGLRNVLDMCRLIGIRSFVFASSVAACHYPRPGQALTEINPADGTHIYATTKRIGEETLREYRDDFHSVIIRFAALFTDWCEYSPLFVFLSTWLSRAWHRRILAGDGLSAIPYLHVRDLAPFFTRLLERLDQLEPEQVLLASPDGAVSHRELFDAACLHYYGHRVKPILMPKLICGPGVYLRDLVGRAAVDRPFERPWMIEYIDRQFNVDALRTRQLLDWGPRPRLEILRRMPFLIENLKVDPLEWHRRNRAALKAVHVRRNLQIHHLLEMREQEIGEEFTRRLTDSDGQGRFPSYQTMAPDQLQWSQKVILRHLMNSVLTRDKAVLVSYCRDLAAHRFQQGFKAREVCDALELLNQVCFKMLRRDPASEGLREDMFDHVTMALRAGCDQAQDVFETLEANCVERATPPSDLPS
jgi:nucleoside-diphosphate-sugar epimerase